MALQAGSELDHGKYRIVRLLDRGGMGSVYEAEHTRSHKRVAIKCLHPGRRGDEADMERLVREAQASARVRHRNVVEVFDVGRDGPMFYLVMEYLEGETLREVLRRRDLPAHRLIALLLPAMQGVAAAHKQGVIHRDVKPENIFLARELDTPEPVTKVLDFGVSKLATDDEQSALTVTGAPLGTPLYMPYEQLCGQKDIDGRADVYAFGVVLYEALTGRLPYQAKTLAELCAQVLAGPPVPPAQLCPELPTSLSRLVMWALKKERDTRLPSMKRLVTELEPFSTLRGMQAEQAMGADERAPGAQDESCAHAGPRASSRAPQDFQPVQASAASFGAASPSSVATHPARRSSKLWLASAAALLSLAVVLPLALRREVQGKGAVAHESLKPTPSQTAKEPVGAPVPAVAPPSVAAPPPVLPVAQLNAEAPPAPKRLRAAASHEHARVAAPVADASAPVPEPSPALAQARARTHAAIQRLTEQLVECDELRTRWLREQCRDDHKREIAEYEEQRELVESATDR